MLAPPKMTERKGLVRISKQPRFDIPDKAPMEYCLVWRLLLGQLVKIAYPPRKDSSGMEMHKNM